MNKTYPDFKAATKAAVEFADSTGFESGTGSWIKSYTGALMKELGVKVGEEHFVWLFDGNPVLVDKDGQSYFLHNDAQVEIFPTGDLDFNTNMADKAVVIPEDELDVIRATVRALRKKLDTRAVHTSEDVKKRLKNSWYADSFQSTINEVMNMLEEALGE